MGPCLRDGADSTSGLCSPEGRRLWRENRLAEFQQDQGRPCSKDCPRKASVCSTDSAVRGFALSKQMLQAGKLVTLVSYGHQLVKLLLAQLVKQNPRQLCQGPSMPVHTVGPAVWTGAVSKGPAVRWAGRQSKGRALWGRKPNWFWTLR